MASGAAQALLARAAGVIACANDEVALLLVLGIDILALIVSTCIAA